MKIDVFNHILPRPYFDRIITLMPDARDMHKRVRAIPCIVDLDERFRIMDLFGEYQQILSLSSPPMEVFGAPPASTDLTRLGNDSMAELVSKHRARFPGFVASLPMNDPEGLLREAVRAVDELGAVGVQVYTNVLGRPLTHPDTMPLFDLAADRDIPIWIHPTRTAAFSDYAKEKKSHYEIWWTLGWPYETSAAMAHIVFSGLFDRHPGLKLITHHLGGLVPYLEGRVGPGWDQIGTRTSDEDYFALLKSLKRRPIDYFRMFYADTATFGAKAAMRCGLDFFPIDRVLFASDSPFDPERGTAYIRWTIEILDGLDLTAEQRHAIYEGNARRILRFPS